MLPDLPTPHASFALLLTLITFAAFATARLRVELICLLLIAVLALGFYLFPLVPPGRLSGLEIAFGGFSHEALIAICCLMILGRGLVMTGALEPAARALGRLWNFNRSLGMLFSLLVCMALSMFVNDTPVLVLALPILLRLATRAGVPAAQTLMPVNCAILIGGMSTTIGTSTNLLVVSLAADLGVGPIGVFSFTSTVLVAAAIALPYLWLVMPRLLPHVSPDRPVEARRYRAVLHTLRAESLGASLRDVVQRINTGAQVVGAVRGGKSLRFVDDPGLLLQPRDQIEIEGTPEQLRDASEELRASLAPPDVAARLLGAPTGPLLDREAVAAMAGIGMREIESLVLSVSAQALGHLPPSAGLIAVDEAFNAMVSRDYLADGAYRGFSFHFRPGVLTPEDQEQRACAALGIAPAAIAGLARVHNRLPALRVGHGERVERIDTALAGTRLGITGNWFQGVSVEDCLTRSHQECERLFA
mgnify:CR=1 FL=1